MTPTTTTSASLNNPDEHFDDLCAALATTFQKHAGKPLFRTKVENLYEKFLGFLPEDRRQHYACHACRNFVNKYGGLVTIDENGIQTPVFWDSAVVPSFFTEAVSALYNAVGGSSVTGVFLSKDKTWGVQENQDKKRGLRWTHLSVEPAKTSTSIKDPGEVMAERTSDFQLVNRILAENSLETFQEALKLLRGGNLARPEAHALMTEWYIALTNRVKVLKGNAQRNTIWLAVATAPAGYTHIRAGVLGTLLDDVKANLPFEAISRKWAEKMGPLAYRRTKAPPTRGNIEEAEKLVAKLGITESLKRRFARLEDLQTLWRPGPVQVTPSEVASGKVFAHLKAKDEAPQQKEIAQPPTVMSWAKFRATVLPTATSIELLVPQHRAAFVGLITAVNMDAPPIVQWDHPDRRNPVTWYLYVGGSFSSQWNLPAGAYVPVTAVSLSPPFWADETHYQHKMKAVDFILQGARDTQGHGRGLFTEDLRNELHAVRSTLESHYNTYSVEGREEATACGLRLQEGVSSDVVLRVRGLMGTMTYRLDRWD